MADLLKEFLVVSAVNAMLSATQWFGLARSIVGSFSAISSLAWILYPMINPHYDMYSVHCERISQRICYCIVLSWTWPMVVLHNDIESRVWLYRLIIFSIGEVLLLVCVLTHHLWIHRGIPNAMKRRAREANVPGF
jgi:hypothetical protein